MTLKEKINNILGDNVRLLLPSYWWKRLFGMVVDRIDEVHPIVDSIEKLNYLNVPGGAIASIGGEPKSFRTCYQIPLEVLESGTEEDILAEIKKATRITGIRVVGSTARSECYVRLTSLYSSIDFVCTGPSFAAILYYGENQDIVYISKGGVIDPLAEAKINEWLNKEEFVYLYCFDERGVNTSEVYNLIDGLIKIGSPIDVYIKDEEWQPLARRKELDSLRTSMEEYVKTYVDDAIKNLNNQ